MNQFDELVSACRYLLNSSPEAEEYLNYLNKRISPESQEQFSFGYLPGPSNLNLLTSLVSEDKLKDMNIFYEKMIPDSACPRILKECWFKEHPLILPYRDAYGEIVGLVGRTLLDDEGRDAIGISKYKNTGKPFKKGNHLFGLFEAKQSIIENDLVYVVEGQFDVIKAREKGIHNIVAVGNSYLTDNQFSLLLRYTKNIHLLLDNDAAGEKGREKAFKKFGQIANISNLYLPFGYKDIDEFFKDNNADSLSFVVKNINYSL